MYNFLDDLQLLHNLTHNFLLSNAYKRKNTFWSFGHSSIFLRRSVICIKWSVLSSVLTQLKIYVELFPKYVFKKKCFVLNITTTQLVFPLWILIQQNSSALKSHGNVALLIKEKRVTWKDIFLCIRPTM